MGPGAPQEVPAEGCEAGSGPPENPGAGRRRPVLEGHTPEGRQAEGVSCVWEMLTGDGEL